MADLATAPNLILAAFDAYHDRFERWLNGSDPADLAAAFDAYRDFEQLQHFPVRAHTEWG